MSDRWYIFTSPDGEEIRLPSVTSVISRTLANPALLNWYYTQTLDSVAALASVVDTKGQSGRDFLDSLTDGDMLKEWVEGNGATPKDIARVAADRGTRAHAYLQKLADCQLHHDEQDAIDLAEKGGEDEYQNAIAAWWVDFHPVVIASERSVYRLEPHGGYAGRLDLLVRDRGDDVCLIDLKTGAPNRVLYVSDEIQLSAYEKGVTSKGEQVDKTFVLLARSDATYEEMPVRDLYDVFESLLHIDSRLR